MCVHGIMHGKSLMQPESQAAAYTLGFLWADGTILDRGRIAIEIKSTDMDEIIPTLQCAARWGRQDRYREGRAPQSVAHFQDWSTILGWMDSIGCSGHKVHSGTHARTGSRWSYARATSAADVIRIGRYLYGDDGYDGLGLKRKHDLFREIDASVRRPTAAIMRARTQNLMGSSP